MCALSPHHGSCTHLVSVPGSALCIIKYMRKKKYCFVLKANKEQRNVCASVHPDGPVMYQSSVSSSKKFQEVQ